MRLPAISILIIMIIYSNAYSWETSPKQKVFIDEEIGYQFTYPNTWKARIYRSGIVVSDVNSPKDRAGVQFRIARLNQPIETYSNTYLNRVEKELRAELNTQNEIVINNMDCLEIELHADRNSEKYYLYQLIYFLPKISKVIIIQAGCKSEEKEYIADIIKDISKSLVITDLNKLENFH